MAEVILVGGPHNQKDTPLLGSIRMEQQDSAPGQPFHLSWAKAVFMRLNAHHFTLVQSGYS
jgi:hypothetical protein